MNYNVEVENEEKDICNNLSEKELKKKMREAYLPKHEESPIEEKICLEGYDILTKSCIS